MTAVPLPETVRLCFVSIPPDKMEEIRRVHNAYWLAQDAVEQDAAEQERGQNLPHRSKSA